MHLPAVTSVLVALSIAAACTGDDAPSTSPTTTRAASCVERTNLVDEPYVEDGEPSQRLDLYQPEIDGCEAVPLVVWVHGGGWSAGDKSNGMGQKVALWGDEGWAVASVNYRLTDRSATDDERLLAPAHNEDVAAALSWLVEHADELGVDAKRIALLGHSAGGGIVAAIAADPGYLADHDLAPDDLACVGPLDTEGFDITTAVAGGGGQAQLYRLVFGDDPTRWRDLSPLTHLGDAPVPDLFLVLRGAADRRAQVTTFADAARTAGATVTIVDLPTFTHEDVNRRIADPSDDLLTPALETFLSECLAG
ncbi:MAG: alpha/beta hydrolase [Microthrixaceae bacterium]